MLVVSDAIKNAYNKYTTQRKSYIQVGDNSFFVQNLDIQADCYEEGNVIGNAIAKIAKFDIETEKVKGIDEFELFDGIWTGNQYEYISLGTFKLFDEEGTDDFFSSITAYDKMINFNKLYLPSLVTFPISLYNFLVSICDQANVFLENSTIPNGEQILTSNPFVEGETLKQILKAICQINGCFGMISSDRLKLLLKGNDTLNLQKFQVSKPEYKRATWKINQVVLGMSNVEGEYVLRQDNDDIAKNGVHKLVINDNPFVYTQVLREAYADNLFNQVKGFGYVAFETKWEGLPYVELGDLLNIDGKESIVLRYNLKSPQGLNSTLSAPSIIDSVIDYVDNSNSIENRQKRTEIIVDKQNQKIESVVSQTGEQNQKIAQVTQTVEELNSKISDIADITTSQENNNGKVSFEKINESEPIRIVVRPIGENISYLYPSDNLFLSDDLYLKDRTIRFTNVTTNEVIDYELPDDLLYYNSENYDEFILDYDGQSCVINKRVGYNADGTTYVLDNSTTIEYPYPKIELTDGDYTVDLLGYDNAYLFVRLMAQNIYTTQFATRAEVNSEISQTANKINSEINQKLSNYSTTTEMNNKITQEISKSESKINLEVNKKVNNSDYNGAKIMLLVNDDESSATINADKVNIEGVITAINNNASTTIDGDKITTGSITSNQVASDVITTKNFSAQEINADNIKSGTISANKINGGTLSGSAINLGNGTFSVDTNGKINSTSGTIGGFDILPEKLTSIDKRVGIHSSTVFSGDPAFYAGGDPWTTEDWSNNIPFYVTHDGYLKANNANISGNINASTGNLGNWSISGGSIYGYDEGYETWLTPYGLMAKPPYDTIEQIRWYDVIFKPSDKRLKNNIIDIEEKYEQFYNDLKPKTFKYNEFVRPDDFEKIHFGFIAQDIVESAEKNDLNDLSLIFGENYLKLEKQEIIALNTWQIQKMKNKLDEAITKIETLENRIKELESDNNGEN